MTEPASAQARLRAAVAVDRRRIARGERPAYHVLWTTSPFGGVDVTILELPLIHLFVPDVAGVLDAARVLVARTLAAEPDAFDVRAGSA